MSLDVTRPLAGCVFVCGPSEETLNLYLCRGAELFDATLSNEAMHQRGKGGLINHLYLLHGHGLRVETGFCMSLFGFPFFGKLLVHDHDWKHTTALWHYLCLVLLKCV